MVIQNKWNFWRQMLALLSVFVNGFIFGCHVQWLSNAAFYLTKPGHVPYASVTDCTYIGSILEVGRNIFSLPSGFIVDRFGRKPSVILGGFINFISWIMLIFCNDLILICIARLVSGMGLAICTCSSISLISEIASPEFRLIFYLILEFLKRSSIIFQSILSITFLSYHSIAIGTTVISLPFFITAFFLLESPYFLIISGKYTDAKKIFRNLHPNEQDSKVDEDFDKLMKSQEEAQLKRSELSFWQLVREKSVLKFVGLGIFYRTWTISGGFLVLNSFLTVVMPQNPLFSNAYYPLITYSCMTLSQILLATIIEKFPRRTLLLGSTLICSFTSLCVGSIFYLDLDTNEDLWKGAEIVLIVIYLTIYGSVSLPVFETVSSELFPVSIKGRASALSVFVRSIGSVMVFQLFDIFTTYFGIYSNFYFYGVNMMIVALVTYFCLPETRGKTLAEVQSDL